MTQFSSCFDQISVVEMIDIMYVYIISTLICLVCRCQCPLCFAILLVILLVFILIFDDYITNICILKYLVHSNAVQ